MLFQNWYLIKGERNFKPRPQNRIFVPLKSSFQNFWRAPSSSLQGNPPWVEGTRLAWSWSALCTVGRRCLVYSPNSSRYCCATEILGLVLLIWDRLWYISWQQALEHSILKASFKWNNPCTVVSLVIAMVMLNTLHCIVGVGCFFNRVFQLLCLSHSQQF